ncbi:MAG: protein kinase domain-containing protein, partial [Gemmatimonadales bacterium]
MPASQMKLSGAEAAQAEQLEHLREATLGEYEIYGELGRGGMATVYLAHEIALDRKVAIKVMSPTLVHGEGMVERFKREARTSASLSHPNIIPVYAVKETDRILYFVMKFVQGRPLDSIIKEMGPLPIPMVQAILAQVGGAFGYAHRRGIIHRDIKPANIMIDDEGWSVVTDFGIAKVSESQGLTMTGMTVGTPTYMSPEQCMAQEVTGASDQYSLGVVAYEMVTGRAPFTGASMMAIMYGHFNDPPAPIEKVRPDCPEPLKAAIIRMLEKDPANRWPSVEEAVAGIGSTPLSHDDPTRTQLIALARSGANRQALLAKMSTPTSPIPKTRSRAGTAPLTVSTRPAPKSGTAARTAPAVVASPRAPKSRVGLILGGVVGLAAVGLVLYLAPWKPHPAPIEPGPAPVEVTPPQSAPATSGPDNGSAATAIPEPVATQPLPPPAPPPQAPPPPAKPSAQAVAAAAQVKHDEEEYQKMRGQALEARGRA